MLSASAAVMLDSIKKFCSNKFNFAEGTNRTREIPKGIIYRWQELQAAPYSLTCHFIFHISNCLDLFGTCYRIDKFTISVYVCQLLKEQLN